ncbi:MAG TPA: GDSL-type esterase/lipase family protein [Bacteroidia bacterium]|nr:GDSL-type esterase/lipase family protein [Bacteroidia bacterium]
MKKLLVTFSTLFLFIHAQEIPEWINISQNKIIFDKDSSDFYRFIEKFKQVKTGKRKNIYIVHFGGSHVQGGFWSESIMNTLQDELKTKGGGYFVFPFKQVKTNSPYYFKTYSNGKWKVNKCTKISDSLKYIGMCGISAITDTSCYVSIKNEWKILDGFTRIKFFYRKNNNYDVFPSFQASKIIEHENYTEYLLSQKLDSISFFIQKKDTNYSEFILDGFSCENDSGGVYYAGFGVNGATSESLLKCALLLHQLKNIQVDLFILSFGVNDVRNKAFSKQEYIQNYDSLISKLKKSQPNSSILLTTISDNYIKRKIANPRTEAGNEAIYEIMKKYQLSIWDLNAVMGGKKSMLKWYKAGLSAKDKIHFNKKGYFILGYLMVNAITDKLNNSSNLK